MIAVGTRVRRRAVRGEVPGLAADLGGLFRDLAKALFDPYRPELHYMRGPGPRWRAKHAPPRPIQNRRGLPALIRLPIKIRRCGR